MSEVKCYLDDYKTIKAYLYKPFSAFNKDQIIIYNRGISQSFKIRLESETDTYYKCLISLDKAYTYSDKFEVSIDKKVVSVEIRHLVSKTKFDEDFKVDVKTLGSFFESDKTTFRIWAPLATSVKLNLIDYQKCLNMHYVDRGVFELVIEGNFELCKYTYLIMRSGKEKEATDPFSYSSGPNARYSIVLNPARFIKDIYPLEYEIKNNTDAIIYELSVRDFTSIVSSNTKTHSKFISLCEEGTSFEGISTGLDYIKDLGITHIQLMPVFDFGSVDEIKYDTYNWGYDPMQYNVTDGTYTSDPYDAYARVNELRKLVNTFHSHNIRVNLDVVFNHIYHSEEYSIENILPFYTFRYYNDEYYSNGSYCGNEVRSEAKFIHDYILCMIERYINLFDIDGLRFDLMGLTDIKTMNDIVSLTRSYKKDFMIYGEGWDMPTTLAYDSRTTMNNYAKTKDIAFFNSRFRDVIKGPTMMSEVLNPGYVLGNLGLINDVKDVMIGCSREDGFLSPCQSVNYIECHDNMTFFDKSKACLKERYDILKKRAKLSIAITLLSQGVPFIHSGQEFMRTKYGEDNTYNKGDYYNQIDYILRNQNIDVVEFTKDMIKLRKKYSDFRFDTNELIKNKVYFEEYYSLLIYHAGDMIVFINPSLDDYNYTLVNPIKVIYNADQFDEVMVSSNLTIKSLSVVVATRVNLLK